MWVVSYSFPDMHHSCTWSVQWQHSILATTHELWPTPSSSLLLDGYCVIQPGFVVTISRASLSKFPRTNIQLLFLALPFLDNMAISQEATSLGKPSCVYPRTALNCRSVIVTFLNLFDDGNTLIGCRLKAHVPACVSSFLTAVMGLGKWEEASALQCCSDILNSKFV